MKRNQVLYRLDYFSAVYYTADAGADLNGRYGATTSDIRKMLQSHIDTLWTVGASLMKDSGQPLLTHVQNLPYE